MTLEELQAKVEELQAEADARQTKIAELSKENAKWRRQAQGKDAIDPDEYAKVAEEAETLRRELDKATKASKSEIDKLSKIAAERETALSQYLLEGGLTDALAKVGVAPEFMDATKALLRSKAVIKAEGGQYQAVMGDKSISEAVAEWAANDGKVFVKAQQNSGGGAAGSKAAGGKSFADLTSEERVALYRSNPQQYEALKAAS